MTYDLKRHLPNEVAKEDDNWMAYVPGAPLLYYCHLMLIILTENTDFCDKTWRVILTFVTKHGVFEFNQSGFSSNIYISPILLRLILEIDKFWWSRGSLDVNLSNASHPCPIIVAAEERSTERTKMEVCQHCCSLKRRMKTIGIINIFRIFIIRRFPRFFISAENLHRLRYVRKVQEVWRSQSPLASYRLAIPLLIPLTPNFNWKCSSRYTLSPNEQTGVGRFQSLIISQFYEATNFWLPDV